MLFHQFQSALESTHHCCLSVGEETAEQGEVWHFLDGQRGLFEDGGSLLSLRGIGDPAPTQGDFWR